MSVDNNVIYDKSSKYTVYEHVFYVFSENLDGYVNTVIEFNEQFYYIGDKPNNIETVIEFYEKTFNIKLSGDQAFEVILDNNFLKD